MVTGISGYLQRPGDAFEERLSVSKVVPSTLERDVDDPRRERALAEGPPPIDEIRGVNDDDRVRRLRVVVRGSVAVRPEYGRVGRKPESIAYVGSRGVVVSRSVVHLRSGSAVERVVARPDRLRSVSRASTIHSCVLVFKL